MIERLQHHFIKRSLGVKRNVPNYLLRLETGLPPLKLSIIKQMLYFWRKILNMPDFRYVKQCYTALLQKARTNDHVDPTYNWTIQIKEILDRLGFSYVWHDQTVECLLQYTGEILERFIESQRQQDVARVYSSNTYAYYASLLETHLGPARYLTFNLPFKKMTLLAQCRLNWDSFYFEKVKHSFSPDQLCSLCNKKEFDDIRHFLSECTILTRSRLSNFTLSNLKDDWTAAIKFSNVSQCNELFLYIAEALRYKKLILEES